MRQPVTGLLVLKDGRIELERYRQGRSETTRFLSASMAKSIVGLLVGIAVDERLDPSPSTIPLNATSRRWRAIPTARPRSGTCCRCPRA